MTLRPSVRCMLAVVVWGLSAPALAQRPAPASDNYDELYARYLSAARTTAAGAATPATPNWVADLFRDPRALRTNDLVTVQVMESISAVGSADSVLTKESNAGISIPSLFGLERRTGGAFDPSNLATSAMSTDFTGKGATARSGEIVATMTARVSEMLPNGDLVLEGVREIDINGDRQVVVLTGVVRPVDIGPNNVVLSPAIGQLRIRYFGRGLIKDNLRPGWLVRVLNKIF